MHYCEMNKKGVSSPIDGAEVSWCLFEGAFSFKYCTSDFARFFYRTNIFDFNISLKCWFKKNTPFTKILNTLHCVVKALVSLQISFPSFSKCSSPMFHYTFWFPFNFYLVQKTKASHDRSFTKKPFSDINYFRGEKF